MVIRTSDDIPLTHERLEGLVNYRETSMKQSAVKVSKCFIVDVLSGTCEFVRPRKYPESGGTPTLRNGKKTDQDKSVFMSPPDVVAYIPN